MEIAQRGKAWELPQSPAPVADDLEKDDLEKRRHLDLAYWANELVQGRIDQAKHDEQVGKWKSWPTLLIGGRPAKS